MADRRRVLSAAAHSRQRRLLGVLLGLAALLLYSGIAQAATFKVGRVVPKVVVVREGAIARVEVTSDMPLQAGDELIGGSRLAIAEINCPGGSVHLLSGNFDAVIQPIAPATPNAKAKCVVELRRGTGVATTAPGDASNPPSEDAEMRSGSVAMTSHHTQFGLSLDDKTPLVGFVLDGTASCRDAEGRKWNVESGSQLDLKSREMSKIGSDHLQRLASAFTRLDLSQKDVADAATQQQLQASWYAVLSKPNDARARVDLAEVQNKAQIQPSRVSAYQRVRASDLATRSADPALINKMKTLSTKPDTVADPKTQVPKPPRLAVPDG
jgi:hypothetical protein